MSSKDFDGWNKIKKTIASRKQRFYREREIWWCTLGINVGYEQDGKGEKLNRPVLILKRISKYLCIIIPITTSIENKDYVMPIEYSNKIDSGIIISQMRLIDARRLANKITRLEPGLFEQIRKSAKEFL